MSESSPGSETGTPSEIRQAVARIALLDWLLPTAELHDPSRAMRARVLGVTQVLLVVAAAFFCFAIAQQTGNWTQPTVLILVVCTLIGFGTVLVFKFFNQVDRIAYVPVIFMYVGIVSMMHSLNGMEHQSLWWLAIIPMVATLLVGPRVAGVFTVVVIATIGYFYSQWPAYKVADNHYGQPEIHFLFRLLASTSVCVFTYLVSYIFESERRRALNHVAQEAQRAMQLNDELGSALEQVEISRSEAEKISQRKSVFIRRMRHAATAQGEALAATRQSMQEMNTLIHTIAESASVMAQAAEDSSSAADEIRHANQGVVEQIDAMVKTVEQTAAAVEQMAASIRQVAGNIDALSHVAESTAASMNQMEASINQVEKNAKSTALLSDSVIDHASQGSESVARTRAGVEAIQRSTQDASQAISDLAKEVARAGKILTVIEEVADQTKLLALNASIIAAQTGEEGRGFAVVADEIKALAARTSASTREIADLIGSVQTGAKQVVHVIGEGEHAVQTGVALSRATSEALDQIVQAATSSTSMVKAIARSTVEQTSGARTVSESMERVAQAVVQVASATGQQARGSEQIMKATTRLRNVASHVESSTGEQSIGIQQILNSISRIGDMVHQVHRALSEQSERSADMLGSIEQIAQAQILQIDSLAAFDEGRYSSVLEPAPDLAATTTRPS